MKTLFVVRHAKSDWGDASLRDFDRPLNKRGLRDAPFMAEKFARSGITVQALITSPATRALATAGFFIAALKLSPQNVMQEKKIYEASLGDLVNVVRSIPDEYDTVMLFGHNPGFSLLSTYICGKQLEMPTCSVAHLEIFQNSWSDLVMDAGRLVAFDYPKKYFS